MSLSSSHTQNSSVIQVKSKYSTNEKGKDYDFSVFTRKNQDNACFSYF